MAGIGEILRDAREKSGVAYDQIEEKTKIKKRYLLALEQEEWDRMPGKVYAKGFLRTYARYLGLDEGALGDMFELSLREGAKTQSAPASGQAAAKKTAAPVRRREVELHNRPKKTVLVFLCFVSIAVLFFAQWVYRNHIAGQQGNTDPSPGITQLPDPLPAEPVKEPEPPPEPEPLTSVTLKLAASESCWLRVREQGEQIHEGTIRPGDEPLEFPGLTQIELTMGNAGGVTLSLNGVEQPALGTSGQVLTKRYSLIEGVFYDDDTGEILF